MPTYLNKFCGITFHHAIMLNTFLIICLLLFIPLSAKIGERIKNPRKILGFSSLILIILAYPIYSLLLTKSDILYFISLLLIALSIAPVMAFIPIILIDYLPIEVRYTGLAIAYNIAYSIFGGIIPLIATYLIHITNDLLIPAYIIICAALVTLSGLLFHAAPTYISEEA